MPYMFGEKPRQKINLDVGELNVAVDPVTAGEVKERSWETTDPNLTLPAGAYSVHVRHVDPSGGTVTVNGQAIGFNRIYERAVREDRVNNKQDFTPEVRILNPEGKKVAISVAYPSSSNVNPALL